MPLTPERLQLMADRQDIWDCLQRISRGIDRFDRESFLSGYHDDAVVDASALVGSPVQAYENGAALHEVGQVSTMHSLLNHYCHVEGDSAHSETYFEYVGHNRDGSNWLAGGRYVDRLEKRAGEWKIANRYCIVEWSGTITPGPIPYADIPNVHASGVPSRDRSDPSYLRPLVNKRAKRKP